MKAQIDFFGADSESEGFSTATGNYEREDVLAVFGVLATLKGEFPVGPVKIFGGGGVGYYFVSLSSELDTQKMGDFDSDDGDGVFGARAVIGQTMTLPNAFSSVCRGCIAGPTMSIFTRSRGRFSSTWMAT